MDSLLTSGSLAKIMSGVRISPSFTPIMQIIGLKEMSTHGSRRFRILISDGVHSLSTGMLGPELTGLVDGQQLTVNTVVKVNACNIPNALAEKAGKPIVIFTDVSVIKEGSEVGKRLGNPQVYRAEAATTGVSANTGTTAMSSVENKPLPTGSSFYGSKPQPKAQPQTPGTPGTPGGGPVKVYPIANITPYQNRWTIKARVTQKSSVRTYSNSRGEGKFFNIVLSDESGEIKATAWKAECDQFYNLVELNKVYYVSKAQLKTANKQFSQTNNDYEMNLTAESRIQACDDDEASSVPTMQFSFVTVQELNEQAVGKLVDVCGIAHQIGEVSTIIAKASQREMTKRDVELVDDSLMAVRLTIWGDEAKNFRDEGHPVLAAKGAKVGEWNGRSLGLISSSQLIVNPDQPTAHRLRGWYDSTGHSAQFQSYAGEGGSMSGGVSGRTQWKTLNCIVDEQLGRGDKSDWYTVKAMCTHIKKENCLYKACSEAGCNKKLVDNEDGSYRCEKCNKTVPEFRPRLLLQCNVSDHTYSTWMTAFQDCAEKILGMSATDLMQRRDSDEDAFDNAFKEACYKPLQLSLRSKMESYNDESRLKTVCTDAKQADVKEYNKMVLESCKKLLATSS